MGREEVSPYREPGEVPVYKEPFKMPKMNPYLKLFTLGGTGLVASGVAFDQLHGATSATVLACGILLALGCLASALAKAS